MSWQQPDHDPFAPHVQELGFDPGWKQPEPRLDDPYAEPGDPGAGEVMESGLTLDQEGPLEGVGPVKVAEELTVDPAASEDADPTPPPGPGKRTRSSTKGTRSKSRAAKLAAELAE